MLWAALMERARFFVCSSWALRARRQSKLDSSPGCDCPNGMTEGQGSVLAEAAVQGTWVLGNARWTARDTRGPFRQVETAQAAWLVLATSQKGSSRQTLPAFGSAHMQPFKSAGRP